MPNYVPLPVIALGHLKTVRVCCCCCCCSVCGEHSRRRCRCDIQIGRADRYDELVVVVAVNGQLLMLLVVSVRWCNGVLPGVVGSYEHERYENGDEEADDGSANEQHVHVLHGLDVDQRGWYIRKRKSNVVQT